MTTAVIDKGTGTVRLATASAQAEEPEVDKKAVHEKAKKAFAAAKQAYAEAEVKHYGHMHKESVNPDELAESREHVDACHAAYMEAKKACVKAEADMYTDDKSAMAKASEEEAEAKAKAEAEAKAAKEKEEAEAKATADANFAKQKQKEREEQEAKENEAKAKAEAEAKAAAEAEAKAKAEAEAKAAFNNGEGSAEAKLAKANAEIEALKAQLATASAKPAVTEPAGKATGNGNKDAIARASVGFDQKAAADGKDGRRIVVLGGKAPTGGNIAIASQGAKAADLSGLFRR